MSVRIARGARTAWRSGALHFRVQSKSDFALLAAAVSRIEDRVLLAEADYDDQEREPEFGAKFVSDCVPLPDGLAFWIDSPDASAEIADRIVGVISGILEEEGIDARLSAPVADYERLEGPQVVIGAVPVHPPARDALPVVPWDEIERRFEWATSNDASDVFVYSGGATLKLPEDVALTYVGFLYRRGQSVHVVVDGTGERRELSVRHPAYPLRSVECSHLALRCGGSAVADDIDKAFDECVEIARTIGDWAASTHVTVNPVALDSIVIRPPWTSDPSGPEAAVALDARLLDAFPWQRVRPGQISALPDPVPDLLRLDAGLGELRCGDLEHWLREIGGAREREFRRALRTMLGSALITRDVAWTGVRRLPSSIPRPRNEPAFEEPVVDLDRVPIGPSRGHPSLGVTSIELLSLLRGGSFDDRVDVSEPLRVLLDHLTSVASEDKEWVRGVVRSLTSSDLGPGHQMSHCTTMGNWLLTTLTPGLAEAVGLDGGKLREQLGAASERPATSTAQVLLEAISAVVSDRPGVLDGSNPRTPEQRSINTVVRGVTEAASTARIRGTSGLAQAILLLRRMIHGREEFTDDTPKEIWNAIAGPIGTDAVLEAFNRAATEEPRHAHLWRAVEPGPFDIPKRRFAAASASAPFRTADPERAWDIVVERGSSAYPDFWNQLNADLANRVSEEEIDAGWAAARRRLALLHPQVRPIASIAVTGACVGVFCEVVIGAADAERLRRLHERTMSEVEELVAQLA